MEHHSLPPSLSEGASRESSVSQHGRSPVLSSPPQGGEAPWEGTTVGRTVYSVPLGYSWNPKGTGAKAVPRAESRTCWVDGEAQTSVNGGAWPVDLPPAAHSKPSDPSDAQQVEGSQVRLRGVRWRVKRASKCHQGLDGIQPTPQ